MLADFAGTGIRQPSFVKAGVLAYDWVHALCLYHSPAVIGSCLIGACSLDTMQQHCRAVVVAS